MSPAGPTPLAEPPQEARDLSRLLVTRPRLIDRPLLRFQLGPADRALVRAGQTVFAGEPLLERVADAVLVEADLGTAAPPAPGSVGRTRGSRWLRASRRRPT